MNADGTNQTSILNVGCCISPYVGSWSPDGTKIVIYSDRFDGNYEIYTINSDGTNRINISNNAASDMSPQWATIVPAELPRTGQTTCYDSAGAVIPCAGTGQDGEIQAGVAWPNPRFTDNGDSTITDNLTGLMWTADANLMTTRDTGFDADGTSGDGAVTWLHALDYVAQLNAQAYLGHTDWRLPNINEIESLVHAQEPNTATWLNTQGFSSVQSDLYWSSTSVSAYTVFAWVVNMWSGDKYAGRKSMVTAYRSGDYYVWPVRSGQFGVAQLWETGQTTCYDSSAGDVIACAGTGQDGDIQAGVSWPSPRFTVSTDGYCVTDNLTGLMWVRSPDSVARTWQEAIDYANGLSLCGYDDWRLSNRKELHGLTDFSKYNPALPSGHPFPNVQSSATGRLHPLPAFRTSRGPLCGKGARAPTMSLSYHVWPVRSGQVSYWFYRDMRWH